MSAHVFAGALRDLATARAGLQRIGSLRTSGGVGVAPRATSGAPLGLSSSTTAATLRSTEEVNTIATSYTTHEPNWSGSSSADPRVTGIYDGSDGDTALTFRVTQVGFLPITQTRIEVRDSSNALVDTIAFLPSQQTNQHALSNGLSVTFTSGSFQLNDQFQIGVSSSTGTAVDPAAAFSGQLDASPEFDTGLSVSAGSFQVNGVGIAVAANDSINSVLAKITASAAGVIASFDAASERILLTSATNGSSSNIALSGDTSGFIAATKLTGATLEAGTDSDYDTPLGQLAAFAGVQSGTFSVNGVALTIDTAVDTLDDVLQRINAAGAGAEAGFTTDGQRIFVRSTSAATLALDDGTSGLFSALHIDTGEIGVAAGKRTSKLRDEGSFRRSLQAFVEALDVVLGMQVGGTGAATADRARKGLGDGIARAFGSIRKVSGDGNLSSRLGLDLVLAPTGYRELDIASGSLTRAISRDPAALHELLFSSKAKGGKDGILAEIDRELAKAFTGIAFVLEGTGAELDVSA